MTTYTCPKCGASVSTSMTATAWCTKCNKRMLARTPTKRKQKTTGSELRTYEA